MAGAPSIDVEHAIKMMVGNSYFETFVAYIAELEQISVDAAMHQKQDRDENLGAARVLRFLRDTINTQRKK